MCVAPARFAALQKAFSASTARSSALLARLGAHAEQATSPTAASRWPLKIAKNTQFRGLQLDAINKQAAHSMHRSVQIQGNELFSRFEAPFASSLSPSSAPQRKRKTWRT